MDEGQNIKNTNTKQTKGCWALAEQSDVSRELCCICNVSSGNMRLEIYWAWAKACDSSSLTEVCRDIIWEFLTGRGAGSLGPLVEGEADGRGLVKMFDMWYMLDCLDFWGLVISGTPVENKLLDMWSLFQPMAYWIISKTKSIFSLWSCSKSVIRLVGRTCKLGSRHSFMTAIGFCLIWVASCGSKGCPSGVSTGKEGVQRLVSPFVYLERPIYVIKDGNCKWAGKYDSAEMN